MIINTIKDLLNIIFFSAAILSLISCDLLIGDKMVPVETPVLSPCGNTFSDDVLVSIHCETAGAKISWKKSTSSSWMVYKEPFTLTKNETIQARAVVNGNSESEIVEEIYIIERMERVETPIILSDSLNFDKTKDVSISCSTVDATIKYQINDGAEWETYTGPVPIGKTTSFIARAVKTGMAESFVSKEVVFTKIPFVSTDLVTIATYNVENFDLGGDEKAQYSYIAQFAMDENIEILVVQEMQTRDSDISGFSTALTNIGYPMVFQGNTSMSDGFNAIGVWSKYPIPVQENILNSAGPRSIYRFKVQVGVNEIWFYGCHLKSGAKKYAFEIRVEQAAKLEEYITNNHDLQNDNIVILGDMNTMGYNGGVNEDFTAKGTLVHLEFRSDDDETNDFTAVNYRLLDSSEHYTFPGENEKYKSLLDHIILSRNAMKNHYETGSVYIPRQDGFGEHEPSDHYPVVLELAF